MTTTPRPPLPLRPTARRRGMILVIAMWVAMALVVVAIEFADSMNMEYRASGNALAGREAEQAIEGARRYVTELLTDNETPGQALDATAYESEQVPVGNAAFWIVGRSTALNALADTPVYGLVDEASKLNINTATLEMLEALPNMSADFAAAIVDWRDSDSDLSTGGAESQTYAMLDAPYECKNAPFETLDELRLVYGADLATLYGEDTNMNGVLDANENDGATSYPEDNADGKLDPGILEYLTLYSREPNIQSDGSARINVAAITNPQQEGPLIGLLTDKLGQTRADAIMQEVRSGLPTAGSVLGFYVLAKTQAGMTASEFALIEDALTDAAGNFVYGRVNVNSACAEVLACLPSVGQTVAEQLVASRQGRTTDELKSIAWVADVITDPAVAGPAGKFMTARSYQFSADVAAVGHNGHGFRRHLFVFDTASGAPSILYTRDRTPYGWPLGSAVREAYQSLQETP